MVKFLNYPIGNKDTCYLCNNIPNIKCRVYTGKQLKALCSNCPKQAVI